jgi:hypothetical protein
MLVHHPAQGIGFLMRAILPALQSTNTTSANPTEI